MNWHKLHFSSWAVSVCCLLLIHGYLARSQTSKIKFQQLSVKDGLSQNWIHTIYQDRKGFLWIGTHDGLNRHNGHTFTIYKKQAGDPASLVNNNVQVIFEDSKDRLWVGTHRGLNLYDRSRDTFIPVRSSHDHSVESLLELDNGSLLVGVLGGLYVLDTERLTWSQRLYNVYVNVIIRDEHDHIWLGTDHGLVRYDPSINAYRTFLISPENNPASNKNNIQSAYNDSKGRIWLGNNSLELYRMSYADSADPSPTFVRCNFRKERSQQSDQGAIMEIIEDREGRLWLGTETSGLYMLEPDSAGLIRTIRHFKHEPTEADGINHNSIQSIYEDNQGTLWIGTYGGGLNYYNKLLDKFYQEKHRTGTPSISNNHVNTLYNDTGQLWIGTEEGLNVYDWRTGEYKSYTHDPDKDQSLGANAVYSIFRDSRGNLWVGTWAGGFNLFDEATGTFRHFMHDPDDPKSIGSSNIFSIAEDQDSNLWIGTMGGGLNKFNYQTETFTRYVEEPGRNSLSNNWVRDILVSSYDELWISTALAVDVYNRATCKFASFRHDSTNAKSISYDGAVVLFEDSRKNIWIGTETGLNLFHREDTTFTVLGEAEGLPANAIKGIAEDHRGNLWVSTAQGISKFHQAIYLPADPQFETYTAGDGLMEGEFNRRTCCSDTQGYLYFGGTQGFNYFHPDSISNNPAAPPIVFTSLQVFGNPDVQHLTETNNVTLYAHQSSFSIAYAALNFVSPQDNQYAYLMEGVDREWKYAGNRTSATYAHLDPGTYTFHVKASNNDGLWTETGKKMLIHVLPPWWLTHWAGTCYLLVLLAVLYFIRRYTIIPVKLKNQLWKEHFYLKRSGDLQEVLFKPSADNPLYPYPPQNSLPGMLSFLMRTKTNEHEGKTNHSKSNEKTNKETDREFMARIIAMIQKHYHNADFSAREVIHEMAMSRSVFYKKYKAMSSTSINDLIRNHRLAKAKTLLEQSDLTVSEVAYASGFNNPTYFSTVFKEHFKVSPGALQKRADHTLKHNYL